MGSKDLVDSRVNSNHSLANTRNKIKEGFEKKKKEREAWIPLREDSLLRKNMAGLLEVEPIKNTF